MLHRLLNRACQGACRRLRALSLHEIALSRPSSAHVTTAPSMYNLSERHSFKKGHGLASSACIVALAVIGGVLTTSGAAQERHYTARFFTSYGSPRKLTDMAFSPSSDHLAVAVKGGPVTILATSSGEVIRKFEFDPHTMCWSADGTYLLAVSDDATRMLHTKSGTMSNVIWKVPEGYLGVRLKEQAGKLLIASVLDGSPAAKSARVHVEDELIAVVLPGRVKSLLGMGASLAAKELAGAAGMPITLRIVPKGSNSPIDVELRRQGGMRNGNDVQLRRTSAGSSPQACVITSAGNLIVIEANSGNVVSVLRPETVDLWGLQALSNDGRWLAKLGKRINSLEPTLEILDVRQQSSVFSLLYDGTQASSLRFSGDGQRLFIGDYDRIEILDLVDRRFVKPFLFGSVPDGPKRNETSLLDVVPNLDGLFGDSRILSTTRLVNSFDVSSDAKMVAIGSSHGQCILWSADRNQILATLGEEMKDYQYVECTRVSPNSRWIAYFVNGTLNIVGIDERRATALIDSGDRE
jgi:WD40 repeat protein